MNYYIEVLKKYAVFNGRAKREEYWMFVLFNFIIGLVFGLVFSIIGGDPKNNIFYNLYALAILIPSIAVSVRRLHDTNRSGWWLLINFIPIVGFIVILVFMASDSQPGENQYGPNPKEIKAS
jgi:uncharacterized membrane protein YhaH (DUF805 family)